MKESLEIDEIITYFQPIISIEKKQIIGYECLARGISNKEIISPIELLDYAYKKGFTISLDRSFREKAIQTISKINTANFNNLFFINIDVSILDKVIGSNHIINNIKKNKIDPESIVLEINESKIEKTKDLITFVEKYKEYGFIIALDDVGKGFSNINRIPMLMPDIIKIDLELIRNIHKNFYKQEVVKSITNLSRKIGSLVIAEGVESKEELVCILKFGVDLIQGYYFSKPDKSIRWIESNTLSNINQAADIYKKCLKERIKKEIHKKNYYINIVNDIIKLIKNKTGKSNHVLGKLVHNYKDVEGVYLLNNEGIQISNTFINKNINYKKNHIFHGARKKTDHSLKKYVYILRNSENNHYVTQPYISKATGNLCITISKYFKNNSEEKLILCVDFKL